MWSESNLRSVWHMRQTTTVETANLAHFEVIKEKTRDQRIVPTNKCGYQHCCSNDGNNIEDRRTTITETTTMITTKIATVTATPTIRSQRYEWYCYTSSLSYLFIRSLVRLLFRLLVKWSSKNCVFPRTSKAFGR